MLPGISGTLFPLRYLADPPARDAGRLFEAGRIGRVQHQLTDWWQHVSATCGPATGLRALFDVMAMPLAALLGFRATGAVFDRTQASVRLVTPSGATVALVVLPWARRPSQLWRDVVRIAADADASWCLIMAPPFMSLLPAGSHSTRRSIDFSFPDVLHSSSVGRLLMLCHAGAFDRSDPASPAAIDRLLASATTFQDRVREDLQSGVMTALSTLVAPGILAARKPADRFDEALTVVYRILFLLFTESRHLVPHGHPIYRDGYAIAALARQARSGSPATGLWDALAAITRLSRTGCRIDDLIVRPFNGRLFARDAAPTLERRGAIRGSARSAAARNAALKTTLLALATRPSRGGLEEICYADLGVEQLGAVYERVLDVEPDTPSRSVPLRAFRSSTRHSDRRKQSGTFYTPQALCDFVVRRTLAPLVAGRSSGAILALRVVDPAMGSGAFLVSACRYLSTAYERALIEEGGISETDVGDRERAQFRRVIAERCLAGVDVNPVAVQLARLSLWLATLAEGKPLGFLDHRLRTGNSLIGASPSDLSRVHGSHGIRTPAQATLFTDLESGRTLGEMSRPLLGLRARPDDTVDDVRFKEAVWARLSGSHSPIAHWRLAADLWCARWFWPRGDTPLAAPSDPEMRAAIDSVVRRDSTLRPDHLARWLDIAATLQSQWGFFHWSMEFADVYYDDAGQPLPAAGFDAVIGNPPWEMLRSDPGTLATGSSGPSQRPLVRFIREAGLFPACDRGHVNLYQPFLERALSLARRGGRVGLVLPSGLATDDGATALRARLLDEVDTDTLLGIDNARGIFPIHRGVRFLVVCATTGRPTREVRARFGVRTSEELEALPDALDPLAAADAFPIRLSTGLIGAVGGSARRIPTVWHMDELTLLERLARQFPKLGEARGWHARFGRELNVTEDRDSFGRDGLPVIEGKHVQPFVVDGSAPRFRVNGDDARRLLPARAFERARLGYRDVSGVGNRWSLIAAIVPADIVTTHTLFCLRTKIPLEQQHYLCGVFNSYVLNFVVRLLMGGHLTTSLIEGLPVPAWTGAPSQRRIARIARRLASSPRNARLEPELQAAAAREYGIDITTFERLLEGFPLVPVAQRNMALTALRESSCAKPRRVTRNAK